MRYLFKQKIIFILLLILILLIHIIILDIYFEKNNPLTKPFVNNNSVLSYVTTLQDVLSNKTSTNADISNLMNLSTALDNFSIISSFSATPKNQFIFSGRGALQKFENYLRHFSIDELDFSYKLNNGYWLNVSASIPYFFYANVSLLFILDLVLVSIIMIYTWTSWRFSSSLEEFRTSAERIGIDLNSTPLNITSGPVVVKETADAINRMRIRINHLLDTRTKMLAGLSHDLRTPITRLKLHLQFIESSDHAEKMINVLDEMEKMIASILDFAMVDSMHEKKVKLDITALINTICEDYIDLGHHITFETHYKRILINGRFMALKRAFTNIIQNAIKYARNAKITLLTHINYIMIIIEDDGPGIPETDLSNVLKAYYRSNSTSSSTPGYGIGLAIAYEIIIGHEGSLQLENIQPTGLRVIVKLPLKAYI